MSSVLLLPGQELLLYAPLVQQAVNVGDCGRAGGGGVAVFLHSQSSSLQGSSLTWQLGAGERLLLIILSTMLLGRALHFVFSTSCNMNKRYIQELCSARPS